VFAAGRAINQQDVGRGAGVALAPLRIRHALAGLAPFDGELIIGIGKPRPGRLRARRLPPIFVGTPSDVREAIDFDLHGLKSRVVKACAVSTFELGFVELRGRHFPAYGGHGNSLAATLNWPRWP
jgi:hypothetical protein